MISKYLEDERQDVLRVLQSKDETRAFYDKISKVYDLLSERTERPVRERALNLFAAQRGECVLEIGFGTGHCLVSMADAVGPSGRVHGIDISEGMLRQAREILGRHGFANRVELLCADATSLPYASETMDGIFMSFTVELFDTPEIPELLGECHRVLRPGGRIVVVGMSKEGKDGLVVRAFEWTHQHFPNFLDCRPIFVRHALEAAGFTIEASEMMHLWVPVEVVRGEKPSTKRRN